MKKPKMQDLYADAVEYQDRLYESGIDATKKWESKALKIKVENPTIVQISELQKNLRL
jgi:hypothetical protein